MIYQVTHITRHTYEEAAVAQCLNEVRLTPRALPCQRVRAHDLHVDPKPATFDHRKDYFGNDVTTFSVLEKHNRLEATARSVIEVDSQPPNTAAVGAWEDARALLSAAPDGPVLEAMDFLFDSPFVTAGPELTEFARPTFLPGRPLLDAARELSRRIHTEFCYEPESTSIERELYTILPVWQCLTNILNCYTVNAVNTIAAWGGGIGAMQQDSSGKNNHPKHQRGRPVEKPLPPPIPDSLENVARAIMQGPPKPKEEWRYMKDR